ncbi:hypothetical protein [Planococcus sp. SSTMD024]|uniref:hypothetical protein n=1 Tax=Planococcus sp. SSTMD024 TaxID=3242163 RepID=UPI00351DDAE4
MTLYRILIFGTLAALTLWLITDFFPSTLDALGISTWLILAALACLVIAIFITPNRDGQPPERGKHSKLTFTAVGLGYPILLMALLTLLGGESSTGYSLASPPVWIAVAVFLWLSYSDDKKSIQEKNARIQRIGRTPPEAEGVFCVTKSSQQKSDSAQSLLSRAIFVRLRGRRIYAS